MRTIAIILTSFILLSFTVQTEPKSKVKVFVIDENGATVEGASVTLYGDFTSYEKEVNPVMTGVTNKKGFIQFKKLEEKKYYILAKKGDYNNNGGENETDILKTKGKNRFEVTID